MLASSTLSSLRSTGILRSDDKSRETRNLCETGSQCQRTYHCIHAARIDNISPALSLHCAPMFPRWPTTPSRFKRPCLLKTAIETVAAKRIISGPGAVKHFRFCVNASNFQIIRMTFRCYFQFQCQEFTYHGMAFPTLRIGMDARIAKTYVSLPNVSWNC